MLSLKWHLKAFLCKKLGHKWILEEPDFLYCDRCGKCEGKGILTRFLKWIELTKKVDTDKT